MQNNFSEPAIKMAVDTWGVKIDTWERIIVNLKFDFSRLILACFHFGHLFLSWDIYAQNGLSKVESPTLKLLCLEWPYHQVLVNVISK